MIGRRRKEKEKKQKQNPNKSALKNDNKIRTLK